MNEPDDDLLHNFGQEQAITIGARALCGVVSTRDADGETNHDPGRMCPKCLELTERLKCVVCDGEYLRGTPDIGHWTDEINGKQMTPYPVCAVCHNTGRHHGWRVKAIEELQTSHVAFQTLGNLALDIAELRRFKLSNSRIEDGVCPNGCSLMLHSGKGEKTCPICNFHLIQRSL